jgi:hypothetical protein
MTRTAHPLLAAWAVGLGTYLPACAADSTAWFQATTQALFDAVTRGDRLVWDRILDANCMITTEDGEVLTRAAFLDTLRPLPAGFSGQIRVRGLTVRDLGSGAVVHYWLDEVESIFGQQLHTTYVETDTYRQQASSWKLLALQATVVPRDLEPITDNASNWPALVGEYRLAEQAASRYRVFVRDGVLYGGSDPRSATRLIPLSPLVFHQQGSIHLMVFVPGKTGVIEEVRELHKYNEVRMRRVVASGG